MGKNTNKKTAAVEAVNGTTGQVERQYHYYPYGALFGECAATALQGAGADSRRRFEGKEQVSCAGVSFLDYPARPYDPLLLQFWTDDPLCEKYPRFGPRLYCGANPVNNCDPTGMKIIIDGTNEQIAQLESLITKMKESELFTAIYNKLDESSTIFTVQYSRTKQPDGEYAQGSFVPSSNTIGIDPNIKDGSACWTIGEEMYHAYQTITPSIGIDNIEYEAKAATYIEMLKVDIPLFFSSSMSPFANSLSKYKDLFNNYSFHPGLIFIFTLDYIKCGAQFVQQEGSSAPPAYQVFVSGVPTRLYNILNKVYPHGLD